MVSRTGALVWGRSFTFGPYLINSACLGLSCRGFCRLFGAFRHPLTVCHLCRTSWGYQRTRLHRKMRLNTMLSHFPCWWAFKVEHRNKVSSNRTRVLSLARCDLAAILGRWILFVEPVMGYCLAWPGVFGFVQPCYRCPSSQSVEFRCGDDILCPSLS